MFFLEEQDRHGISDGCKDMVYLFETAMAVMAPLSDLLTGNTNLETGKRVATEMEKAKGDFETAFTEARNYFAVSTRQLFECFSRSSAIQPGNER